MGGKGKNSGKVTWGRDVTEDGYGSINVGAKERGESVEKGEERAREDSKWEERKNRGGGGWDKRGGEKGDGESGGGGGSTGGSGISRRGGGREDGGESERGE